MPDAILVPSEGGYLSNALEIVVAVFERDVAGITRNVEHGRVDFVQLILGYVFGEAAPAAWSREESAAPITDQIDARIRGHRDGLNAAAGVAHHSNLRCIDFAVILAVVPAVLGDRPVNRVDQLRILRCWRASPLLRRALLPGAPAGGLSLFSCA